MFVYQNCLFNNMKYKNINNVGCLANRHQQNKYILQNLDFWDIVKKLKQCFQKRNQKFAMKWIYIFKKRSEISKKYNYGSNTIHFDLKVTQPIQNGWRWLALDSGVIVKMDRD